MQHRISVITLGVDDLERALRFYRDGLGLQSPGIVATEFEGDEEHSSGAVVMFELADGLILALYPRTPFTKTASRVVQALSCRFRIALTPMCPTTTRLPDPKEPDVRAARPERFCPW